MSERTLVPIFVFWAFLTIITPTLILLSENSEADFDFNENKTEGIKGRRMMGDPENHMIIRTQPALNVVAADEVVPAPAPAPSLGSYSYSYHDQSNSTDIALEQTRI